MKRTEAQSVSSIIDTLLHEQNLDARLDEQKILANWDRVVGPAINRLTTQRYISQHRLTVHISSAPLRNELMMHRSRLVEALNATVGREVITEVVIQ